MHPDHVFLLRGVAELEGIDVHGIKVKLDLNLKKTASRSVF